MSGSELANADAIALFGTSQPAPKQRKLKRRLHYISDPLMTPMTLMTESSG